MEKEEYIICAAMIVVEDKRQFPCVENRNLRIGMSHSEIISKNEYSDRKVYVHEGYKGFLTSNLDFIFRQEAAIVAYQAGQVSSKRYELYSDDFDMEFYYEKFCEENKDKVALLQELRK